MSDSDDAGQVESGHQRVPSILVGVDGSESSIRALRHARRLADALNAPLEAVSVWLKAYSMYDFYQSDTGWTPAQNIEKMLDVAVEQAFGADIPARFTRTVLEGAPSSTLIRYSAGAEMLVLGGRGHGGFTGLILGSVSSACVAHAPCPVLIVHNDAQRRGGATGSRSR
ncbi:universal stress protein [Mycetocola zhadangensis]|uniref:Universal stress protein n=1 Tax=Mycetocola zhadangensis TaxID=1164595 RepID=A0A3L7J1K1_9MICO|nr:universal stress protein [Mycetocola zhadangensis]RLQ84350.1 universal stress protein [Mycetocola zhadangensis]GGE93788.1 universal stress protein [Mycetocola zhadangensis]